MNHQQKTEKLLQIIRDNGYTAYHLSRHTNLSVVGIQKIIDGKTKKPSWETIDKLYRYVQSPVDGDDLTIAPQAKLNYLSIDEINQMISALHFQKFHFDKDQALGLPGVPDKFQAIIDKLEKLKSN